MKFLLTTCFSLALVFGLGYTSLALGAEKDPLGLSYGEATGLSNQDVRFTVGRIINVALSLLGTITVVIILYAGFEWMTAGGSEDKVEQAKKRITYAVIGLAIIMSAYAISSFVVSNLYDASTGNNYIQ
jgi:amino acid transporter